MGTYLDEAGAKLKEFEGSVGWMYLDTVGKVTVGVGQMLPSILVAQALGFVQGDRRATAEEIAAEFERVTAMPMGKLAKFYARAGGIRLPDEAIAAKLHEALEGFEGYLRKHIQDYDRLPDAAKLALLDMVYNLGPGKLFAEYPRLIAAVAAGGPGAARNGWTRQQFLSAAKQVQTDLQAAAKSPALRWVMGGFAALFVTLLVLTLADKVERR